MSETNRRVKISTSTTDLAPKHENMQIQLSLVDDATFLVSEVGELHNTIKQLNETFHQFCEDVVAMNEKSNHKIYALHRKTAEIEEESDSSMNRVIKTLKVL